ncbi:unnamed protein product [Cuscuta epithymum]|uniref:BZIP domain-containing protein n=1 Tax=Cuscuta epithymum TaxID=186058 RepID=A0AAV0DAS1_9ASTE|nr:unnamed protein product [Cuscuta epithymum]
MEEFWKVITLSSPFPPPPANAVGFRTTTLQEFLPLSTEYGGGASNCHPATDLFVTSNAPAFVSSDAVNCAAIPLPSRRLHPVSRKRGGAGSDADRRYEQRLIKNRESAERSRAKKQVKLLLFLAS